MRVILVYFACAGLACSAGSNPASLVLTPQDRTGAPFSTFYGYVRGQELNARDGLSNHILDQELSKMEQVPYIREWIRREFGVSYCTTKTLDQLADYLCVKYQLSRNQVDGMPLGEVVARLRYIRS